MLEGLEAERMIEEKRVSVAEMCIRLCFQVQPTLLHVLKKNLGYRPGEWQTILLVVAMQR